MSKEKKEFFVIARLSRDDFRTLGFNADALSDDEMQDIADKMGDSFVSEQFWIDVEFFAREKNLTDEEGDKLDSIVRDIICA